MILQTKSRTYGIIGGIIIIGNVLLMVLVWNIPMTGLPQTIALLLYSTIIILSLFSFSKSAPAGTGLKIYFTEGFKTFVVMTFMLLVFTFFYYKVHTQVLEQGISQNQILLQAEGNHTPAEIETNSAKLRSIFMPMMLSITTIILLIVGCLITLICAAVLKNKKLRI